MNNAIGETLKSGTGEDFWWFNNGVTVVADAAQIAGKRIVVKDPQIVNGLRTNHDLDQERAIAVLTAVLEVAVGLVAERPGPNEARAIASNAERSH
ncbi:AIPR family protein [Streptomyces sp. NPDC002285]